MLDWGRVALERFTALARDPDTGVAVREGVVVERGAADRWWTEAVPTWREARADELPAGASGGVVATVPLVTMPVFLPWLETRCLEAGVDLVEGLGAGTWPRFPVTWSSWPRACGRGPCSTTTPGCRRAARWRCSRTRG